MERTPMQLWANGNNFLLETPEGRIVEAIWPSETPLRDTVAELESRHNCTITNFNHETGKIGKDTRHESKD